MLPASFYFHLKLLSFWSLFYLSLLLDVYYQCTGEHWPFLNNGEMGPIQYLQQIGGILSLDNDKNETLWYVRGKTLNGENRGEIYRSNNQPIASSEFDLSNKSTWQQPHGSQSNTCTQYNNNFLNGRSGDGSSSSKYNSSERNNNGYINHNTNNINGNYASRNNMQLVSDTFYSVFFFVL